MGKPVIVGWDLDGIFVRDLTQKEWDLGLDYALPLRDSLPLLSNAPDVSKKPESNVLITGRPEMDREVTESWLRKYGYANTLVMKGDHDGFSLSDIARYKARYLISSNCFSTFVESDAEQAILIANFLSKSRVSLEVLWWNNGNTLSIQAS